MISLTPEQIDELTSMVREMHLVFVAAELGTDALPDSDLLWLAGRNVNVGDFGRDGRLLMAYQFGAITQALGEEEAQKLTYEEFRRMIQAGQAIPLTEAELFVISNLRAQAVNAIKDQQAKIESDVKSAATSAAQAQAANVQTFADVVLSSRKKTLLARETARFMAQNIADRVGGWARDLDRIADTVMHEAFDMGRAQNIISEHGADAQVYKDVYSGACQHCVRLYLTAGVGSKPRVFRVSELVANGTNAGKPSKSWVPVVGPTHPWCRCTLNYLPPKSEWDPKAKEFVVRK